MNEIKDLVEISKYAGERFDLTQAGGGNSSVKLENGCMLIKASGYLLSDVEVDKGYSTVVTEQVAVITKCKDIINEKNKRKREHLAASLVENATIDKENRPSIETILHSSLHKFTLHTHSVVVNMITIQKNWKEILLDIFNDYEIGLIPYRTPGIDLGIELNKNLQDFKNTPNIIFLQNHGLIVSSERVKDISLLNEMILERIENYLKIDMNKYKLPNKISALLKSIDNNFYNITYLSDDSYLCERLKENKDLFFQAPFCPDVFVFCGIGALEIENLEDSTNIKNYRENFFELPKVIIFDQNIFFIAPNIKKAKEMEEVMKFHIMVLKNTLIKDKIFLEVDELAYLNNWEAEKFRQKL